MAFKHDYTGVQEMGDFSPIPKATYILKITDTEEGETRNGDPKVKVTLRVNAGKFKGKRVQHNVSFLDAESPGSGFSKHWLHVLGQPFEGEVNVNPLRWRGKVIECDVSIREYVNDKGVQAFANDIDECRPVGDPSLAPQNQPGQEPEHPAEPAEAEQDTEEKPKDSAGKSYEECPF